ncbi:MAG: ATP synthase F1 subunit delta [Acholeplasmataceae bacterium]|nr:ATP synthase F1 subunit delta [Acholeplasmataceae bacterium]
MQKELSFQYAKALYELANSNHQKILEQLDVINQVVRNNEDFYKFLTHPKIDDEDKKALIKETFIDFEHLIIHFLYVLIDNKRIDYLDSIVTTYRNMYYEEKNIIHCEVISATSLSNENIEKIKNVLCAKFNKEILLDVKINPEHLGGLIIKHDDQVLDDSILTKMGNIREHLKNRKLR